jgi:hypothetical protein
LLAHVRLGTNCLPFLFSLAYIIFIVFNLEESSETANFFFEEGQVMVLETTYVRHRTFVSTSKLAFPTDRFLNLSFGADPPQQ